MKCEGSGRGSYSDYEGSSYGDCPVCGKDVRKNRYGELLSHRAAAHIQCRACAEAAAAKYFNCPVHGIAA